MGDAPPSPSAPGKGKEPGTQRKQQQRPSLPPAAQELLAGFAAGAANVTSGYPFDTIKVRLQSAARGQYRGALDCLAQVVRQEGVRRGLFRGLSSPLMGGTAETGVNYMVYSRVLEGLQSRQSATSGGAGGVVVLGSAAASAAPAPPPPLWHVAAAGALAGVCLSAILGPTELVKCRMQQAGAAARYPGGPLQCLREIVGREGGALRGLSRGLGATLAREVPGNALFFTVYEGLRRVLLGAAAPAVHGATVKAAEPAGTVPGGLPTVTTSAATTATALPLIDLTARAEGVGSLPPAPTPDTSAAVQHMPVDVLLEVPAGGARRHWLTEAALAVFCGGAAGTMMWAAVLPIDVAKTRLQTAQPGSEWDVSLRRHWVMLWREGGLASLYSGLVPTLARAFPANACQWLAWELAMRGLQGLGERR